MERSEAAVHISALTRATGREISSAKKTLAPEPTKSQLESTIQKHPWTSAFLEAYNPAKLFLREQADRACIKVAETLGTTFEQVAITVRKDLATLGLGLDENPSNKEAPWESSPKDIIYITSQRIKQVKIDSEGEIPEELAALHDKARKTETKSPDIRALLDSLIGQYHGVKVKDLAPRFTNYSNGGGLPMLMVNTNISPLANLGLEIHRRNGILILGPKDEKKQIILPVPLKQQREPVEIPTATRQQLEEFLPSLERSTTMHKLLSLLMDKPTGMPIEELIQQINFPAIYEIAQNLNYFYLKKIGVKIQITNNLAILVPCQ